MKPTSLEPKIADEPDSTEAEIDALLARLPKQYTTSKQIKYAISIFFKVSVQTLPVYAMMCLMFHESVWYRHGFGLWQNIMVTAIPPAVTLLIVLSQMHSDGSKLLKTHPKRNARDIVGYCLDVVNTRDGIIMSDGNISPEASALLTYFLPRLSVEEMRALDSRQRARLGCISRSKGPRLVCATLGVIAVVGDKSAIPSVESLLKRTKDPSVRSAAQECLVVMRERNALLTDSSVLLRASQPATHPQELLRAAAPVPETRPQELLLPADAETQKLVQ